MAVHLGLWCTNRSGGYVQSRLFQNTDWSFPYLVNLAQTAEQAGFHFMLIPQRYLASHGGTYTLESIVTASALAPLTKTIQIISAIHPGIMPPAVTAKMAASIDYISQGRWNLMLVSGWFQKEMEAYGEWIDHSERYTRSEEFIEIIKGLWKEDWFSYEGKHYHIKESFLSPKPISSPIVFQGGSSEDARELASRQTDWFLINGSTPEDAESIVKDVRERAKRNGRDIKFGMSAFVICRDTEREAREVYEDILNFSADDEIAGFQERVKNGAKGMWQSSSKKDLVQFNDGFKADLVGTPEQIAERIAVFHEKGIELILFNGLHLIEDVHRFSQKIIPLLKEKGIFHEGPYQKPLLNEGNEHLLFQNT